RHCPVTNLVTRIRLASERLGFARMGICTVEPFERGHAAWQEWLEAERHGTMAYMAEHSGRATPTSLLPEAKSLVVVALPYGRPRNSTPLHGRVAAYALGSDYHRVLKEKLAQLAQHIEVETGGQVLARACVDSAPLLEREAAHRAGVGFIAKSTMVIAPGLGSYVLLGELLLNVELPASTPAKPRCGRCRSCLDACPTGAFVDAYVLDARRCISYLTIEHRGSIPRELRALMGDWVFGCDVCQQVCPFNGSNKPRPVAPELAPSATRSYALIDLLELGSAAHRRLVAGTALRRAPRWQLMRNAAVALGNSKDSSVVPGLERALRTNRYPIVREHAAWALGRLGAVEVLVDCRETEEDEAVLEEIELSLADSGASGHIRT
ncbi:MAG: tRNA epoxyqueuosine(34) reductase QueG, partial [Myxococcota bacterium]